MLKWFFKRNEKYVYEQNSYIYFVFPKPLKPSNSRIIFVQECIEKGISLKSDSHTSLYNQWFTNLKSEWSNKFSTGMQYHFPDFNTTNDELIDGRAKSTLSHERQYEIHVGRVYKLKEILDSKYFYQAKRYDVYEAFNQHCTRHGHVYGLIGFLILAILAILGI